MSWTRHEAEEFATLRTLVGEIHDAVIGDNSPNSSLRERTATLEEWRRAQEGLRHRSVRAGGQAILTAAVAIVVQALHLSTGGHA